MIQLDFQSRVPIYEQLVKWYVRLCTLDVLSPGDQIQPIRSLATELGINPNTVQKAYQILESQGLIYSTTGRGSFISSDAIGSKKLLDAEKEQFKNAVKDIRQIGVTKKEAQQILDNIYDGKD